MKTELHAEVSIIGNEASVSVNLTQEVSIVRCIELKFNLSDDTTRIVHCTEAMGEYGQLPTIVGLVLTATRLSNRRLKTEEGGAL